jgi:hypothetical protein
MFHLIQAFHTIKLPCSGTEIGYLVVSSTSDTHEFTIVIIILHSVEKSLALVIVSSCSAMLVFLTVKSVHVSPAVQFLTVLFHPSV